MMRIYWLRLAPVFMGIFVLAWFVPQTYLRSTRAEYYQVSGMYSPVFKEFVLWETGSSLFIFKREDGTRLSLREGRMATPFSFPKDIEKWGGFPLEIDGQTITYTDAQENAWARVNPRAVMLPMSRVQVLMESAPETSSYKLPPDIMLVDDNALRFVDCATGKENPAKGKVFTAALNDAGVHFPLQAAASNPDPYKGHDEGMFFVDASGALFQLRMVKGQPLCRNTGHKISGKPLFIDVKEKRNSDFLGVIATDNGLFLNLRNTEPLRLPVSYEPGTQSVSLWITPLDATITVKGLGPENQRQAFMVATDNKFRVLRNLDLNTPPAVLDRQQNLQRGLSLLTPFSIVQFEPHIPGTVLHVRPAQYPLLALAGCVLSSIVLLVVRRRARATHGVGSLLRWTWPELVLTLTLGLPALLMLLLMGPLTRPSPPCCSVE
ncbi:DUF4857 domain-containing protein [Desulfovibrio intestinalis]|uniref:DUF4857 domain-containing protein n=1 Tax=Desulfovibrio intestinalis TaxID=58621 RepID=A0A7W8FDR1_9BACT|nr:DUF4857 domain-containing protein [Desulfovibrio intestinalis]MBB5141978.1 hypothetical protein [Desulfovibrio intestinalis]